MSKRTSGLTLLLFFAFSSISRGDQIFLEKKSGGLNGCANLMRIHAELVEFKKFVSCSLRKEGSTVSIMLGQLKSELLFPLSPALGDGNYFVRCLGAVRNNGTPTVGMKSESIFVQFSGTPPELQQVSIAPNDIWGGNPDTDKSLTLTVELNKPAAECGTTVSVSSSNSNIARLTVGNGGIYQLPISEGKQTETLSWFLGTKKKKNGLVNIQVRIGNGPIFSAPLNVK